MKKSSRLLLTIALLLIAIIGIFPPWKYQLNATIDNVSIVKEGSSKVDGFHFIYDPPGIAGILASSNLSVMFNVRTQEEMQLIQRIGYSVSIDIERLFIIWFTILILSLLIYILFESHSKPQP